MAQEKRPLRKRIWLIIFVILAPFAVWGGWIVYQILYTLNGLPDAYAMWDTGVLLVDYMQHHGNRWPAGWDDLRESYERLQPERSLGEHLHGGMTLGQLRERVSVDWNVDTAKLTAMPAAPTRFDSIHARDGNTTQWEGADPNEMVWEYLHGKYPTTRPADTQSASSDRRPAPDDDEDKVGNC